MSSKLLVLINFIIIMMLSPTFTYSTPLIEQDIGDFYCRNGTNSNLYCCPLLTHRMVSQNPQYQQSLSIILNNKSGYDMILASANLENGHWVNNNSINCEPQTDPLENGQSEAFASSSDERQHKMQGLITFIMNDGTLVISWKLPITDSNDYFDYFFSGKKYNIDFQTGIEDTILQVTVSQEQSSSFWTNLIIVSLFLFLILLFGCFKHDNGHLTSKTRKTPQSYDAI